MINVAVVGPQTLPRIYSTCHISNLSLRSINNYETEYYKELVRAAPCRSRSMRDINLDFKFVMQQQIRNQISSRKLLMNRCCSVVVTGI